MLHFLSSVHISMWLKYDNIFQVAQTPQYSILIFQYRCSATVLPYFNMFKHCGQYLAVLVIDSHPVK